MPNLETTFDTLARSANEAAIAVLAFAISAGEPLVRGRASIALASRREPRCGRIVLEHWSMLDDDSLRQLAAAPGQIAPTIRSILNDGGDMTLTAIQAAGQLQLAELICDLIELAETHATHTIRQSAAKVVVELAEQIGIEARAGRENTRYRPEAIKRLTLSLEQMPIHKTRDLADAFLLISTARDNHLIERLADTSPMQSQLVARMTVHPSPAMADLLASFVRRARLSPVIAKAIRERQGDEFRAALLRYVGSDPSGTALFNLKNIGSPICCVDAFETAVEWLPGEHAAMLHVASQTTESAVQLLRFLVAAIKPGDAHITEVAASLLNQVPPPTTSFWIPIAIRLAADFDSRTSLDEDARLLGDLIDLLSHPDSGVVHAVNHVLASLCGPSLIPHLSDRDSVSRARLGNILTMIDPSAIDTVRDRMRHPVLKNRLEAIAAADSLGIADLLADSFKQIVRNDHQVARQHAAQVLAGANGAQTFALLEEMLAMPESLARDAAVAAHAQRTLRKELTNAPE